MLIECLIQRRTQARIGLISGLEITEAEKRPVRKRDQGEETKRLILLYALRAPVSISSFCKPAKVTDQDDREWPQGHLTANSQFTTPQRTIR